MLNDRQDHLSVLFETREGLEFQNFPWFSPVTLPDSKTNLAVSMTGQ